MAEASDKTPRYARAQVWRLLADGRERLLTDPGLQAELDLVVAEIEARYAPLLAGAGFFRRLRLRRQMRKEIEREIELRAPSGALYVRAR